MSVTNIPVCHACGRELTGSVWQVAVRTDSVDRRSGKEPRSWRWRGVCGGCMWEKGPGKSLARRAQPIAGEL